MRQTRCRDSVARGRAAEVVGAPLQRQDEAVVVVPERGGALQVQHVGVGGQLGDGPRRPSPARAPVDAVVAAQQRAARLGLLVDQHHPGAGPGGGQRGGEPGRSGPTTSTSVCTCWRRSGRSRHLGEPPLPGDAVGDQAVGQLDGGGQQHRLGEWLLDLDQAVGSSAQAAAMPRGRPSLMLVATW